MRQAYYNSSIEDFLNINNDEIVGKLNKAGTVFASQWTITTTSWGSSIEVLKKSFIELIDVNIKVKQWHILLEYEIPRIQSRIDAVVIAEDLIFVIEFKYDRSRYEAEDIRQAEDYANKLFDFHLESKGKIIIPILLAPFAKSYSNISINNPDSYLKACRKANAENFSKVIYDSYIEFHKEINFRIDPNKWEQSEYQPTPTIVQAAKALFAGQQVEKITKSGADGSDLKRTIEYLIKVINQARLNNKKIVCFVTGVPGAGKTLVGLNIVHAKEKFGGEDVNAAYFSGNGPLINVLREALSRDALNREIELFKAKEISVRPTKLGIANKIEAKIQNLHQYIKDGIRSTMSPTEKVVVFDEAQRCWNAKQFSNKAKQNVNREKNPFTIEEKSEAELLFEFMNRNEDWSVIIALVGGGQEINTGEGGIAEWGKAIKNKYSNWEIHISEQLLEGDTSTAGQTLFESMPSNVTIHKNNDLHLSVSQRSFKANNLNSWVNALIENCPEDASRLSKIIKENFPLFVTRNINTAKDWLMQRKFGTKRFGLIASSGGLRLKPYGIQVREIIDEAMWFLNDEKDVRSSYYLEIVATEYKVQGLELDWVGICWDADLRRNNKTWEFKNFSGTRWKNTNTTEEKQFLLNTYRVLLTRSREGMVVFVPEGDSNDPTRLPEFYDPIFEYLTSCGMDSI